MVVKIYGAKHYFGKQHFLLLLGYSQTELLLRQNKNILVVPVTLLTLLFSLNNSPPLRFQSFSIIICFLLAVIKKSNQPTKCMPSNVTCTLMSLRQSLNYNAVISKIFQIFTPASPGNFFLSL